MSDEKPEAIEPNPANEGGGEPAATNGAGEGGGEGEGSGSKKVTIPEHEYTALQGTRAREEALKEENARLKAQAEAVRTPPTANTSDAEKTRASIERRERHMARLREAAEGGDEASQVLLSSMEVVQESEQRTLYRLQMADIPASEREAVKKYMAEQGIAHPAVAQRLMRGERFESVEQENARLKAENEALKKGKPAPKVEDTRIVGSPGGSRGPATKKGAPIPLAEYHKRMRDDPAKTIADRKAGEFTISVD